MDLYCRLVIRDFLETLIKVLRSYNIKEPTPKQREPTPKQPEPTPRQQKLTGARQNNGKQFQLFEKQRGTNAAFE